MSWKPTYSRDELKWSRARALISVGFSVKDAAAIVGLPLEFVRGEFAPH